MWIKKNYHIAVEKKNRIKILLLIYIINLLEAIQKDGDSLLYYYEIYEPIEGKENFIKGWLIEVKTCLIFFVPIFSYLILHTEIHRHHFLALLFGYIGAIIVNGCRFFLDVSYINDYPFHLLNIFFGLLYSLAIVLIKYLMTKYILLSPYVFLFYDGIFNIINSILLTLLQYIIIINLPDDNKNINKTEENDKYFSNNFLQIILIFIGQNWKFYECFFLSFIFSFLYYIINALIIYNYSPFLIILVEALLPFDNDVIKVIFHTGEEYIVNSEDLILKRFGYQIIGYIFPLFGSLILNEIIIFNFCDLNKYTSKNIYERGEIDKNSFIELYNCNDSNADDSVDI